MKTYTALVEAKIVVNAEDEQEARRLLAEYSKTFMRQSIVHRHADAEPYEAPFESMTWAGYDDVLEVVETPGVVSH